MEIHCSAFQTYASGLQQNITRQNKWIKHTCFVIGLSWNSQHPKCTILPLIPHFWCCFVSYIKQHWVQGKCYIKHAYQALDIACSLLLPSHVHPLDKWLLLRTVWQKRAPIQHRSKPQCMTNHKKRLCFPSEPVHCLESGKSRVWGIKGKKEQDKRRQTKKKASVNCYVHSFVIV